MVGPLNKPAAMSCRRRNTLITYNESGVLRDCSSLCKQREDVLGALALGLPEVSQANVSRVGWNFHPVFGLGQDSLPAAARPGKVAARGDSSPGV
jgi:hypothetical protein